MPPFQLHAHPDHTPHAHFIVRGSASRRPDGRYFVINFQVFGDVDCIAWHEQVREGRADDLWRHSCFEAFIGGEGSPGYVELNLAPARQWALYAFEGYRSGMRNADDASIARVEFFRRDLSVPRIEMQVLLELPARYAARDWEMNLSAVIEELDGTKSYWALAHAPGPPDFHNRDCFIATLPAPDPA